MSDFARDRLQPLLEALCEERLSEAERAELDHAVVHDPAARRAYLEYVTLHGMLHWDAASGAGARPLPRRDDQRSLAGSRRVRQMAKWAAAAATAAVLIGVAVWGSNGRETIRDGTGHGPIATGSLNTEAGPGEVGPPVVIDLPEAPAVLAARGTPGRDAEAPGRVVGADDPGDIGSIDETVAFVDRQIEAKWREAGIEPSPLADDAEWLRRVHLDLIGRIPAAEEVETFLAEARDDKRPRMIDSLLAEPAAAGHFATVWTNLLVGRAPDAEIDRDGLHAFLTRQFLGNRPWSETVTALISAEGSSRENGAANFLLAHLNNEAVPATAVTARCFLGTQVQCTQCHAHPFYKAWGQEQFWELNSFFQQTAVVRHTTADRTTGAPRFSHLELVTRDVGGPTFYETRAGEMKVAFPEVDGNAIDAAAGVNRRRELARLLTSPGHTQLAAAFANRTWSQFFGAGFTRPIDDMGPHNPPSHPEVLARLGDDFQRSGFDVQRLCRIICLSWPYQLTSRFGPGNAIDAPESGEPAYFSRMSVRSLTAEQLYDSLQVVTYGASDEPGAATSKGRQAWLAQFYRSEQTEENCEASTFDGALPQALVLMNGALVREAIEGNDETRLSAILGSAGDEAAKIRQVSLTVVSRPAGSEELAALRKHVRQSVRARPPGTSPLVAQRAALQDVFWAYLNSSEFIMNH